MTPVKEETERQLVILAFTAVGTVVTIYLVQHFHNPDAFRTLKMRIALQVKRFAQKQADLWQGIATEAATAYNREKL